MDQLKEQLIQIVGIENVKENEAMSRHTTFRIGGPAQYMVMPECVEQIAELVKLCVNENVPYFILGHGSNMLVGDLGMDGVVIKLYQNFAQYSLEGDILTAQAGVMLSKLGNVLYEASLTGFEFAAGIPGTLGGAVMMNAGAYGGEMKDVVQSVQLMDENGTVFTHTCEEMDFGYRHSVVEDKNYIVLGATLKLQAGEQTAIKEKMDELALARKTKQPLEYPSAGSTFKRPEGHFAGKLIQDAGLRGYQVGDAQVSEKHCGFVINKGTAKAADVLQLIEDVKIKVKEQFDVELEPEVRLVGKQ